MILQPYSLPVSKWSRSGILVIDCDRRDDSTIDPDHDCDRAQPYTQCFHRWWRATHTFTDVTLKCMSYRVASSCLLTVMLPCVNVFGQLYRRMDTRQNCNVTGQACYQYFRHSVHLQDLPKLRIFVFVCIKLTVLLRFHMSLGGTAAAAPPPFRPSDPAFCGSCPLVTPY